MAEPDRKLSRDALIQGAGATSLASLLVAAAGAVPAPAEGKTGAGPWNLSLARLALLKLQAGNHAHTLPATTDVTAVLVFDKLPTAAQIPNPFTPIAVYEIDMPWIDGMDENGTSEPSRQLTHNIFIVMCTG